MEEGAWRLKVAKRQRFVFNGIITVAVVTGIVVGAWLELGYDLPGEGLGIVSGVLLAAGVSFAAIWPLRQAWPMPACPQCRKPWSVLDDKSWKLLEAGQCPHCRVALTR